jgi:hypothetical protein
VSSHGKQQVWLSKSQPSTFYTMSRGLSPAKNWKDRHRRTKDRWQKKSMIKNPGYSIKLTNQHSGNKKEITRTIYRARLLLLGNATRFFDQSQWSDRSRKKSSRSWKNCHKPVGLLTWRNGAKTISLQTLFGRLNYHINWLCVLCACFVYRCLSLCIFILANFKVFGILRWVIYCISLTKTRIVTKKCFFSHIISGGVMVSVQ